MSHFSSRNEMSSGTSSRKPWSKHGRSSSTNDRGTTGGSGRYDKNSPFSLKLVKRVEDWK